MYEDEYEDEIATEEGRSRRSNILLIGGAGLGLLVVGVLIFLLWQPASPANPETLAMPTIASTAVAVAELALDEVSADLVGVTPTPLPTSTPVPAFGQFVSPEEDQQLGLNDSILLELTVADPMGISNIQILDNGQTIFSQRYSGEQEVSFSQQWVPLSDGYHLLEAQVTNGAGEIVRLAEVKVRIIDFDFIESNREILNRIEADVASIRGLPLKEPVIPHLMGQTELKQYMRSFEYTPADAYNDMLSLYVFDFLDRGYDLYEASIEFTGSSIAGFYDPATKEFVIVSTDRRINILEENTYAHELMHALQDQYFSLGDLSTTPSSDTGLALRSLAEGEAELLEGLYQEKYFSYEQQVEIFNQIQRLYGPSQYTIEPVPVLSEQFYFPYSAGAEFVRNAYDQGGWDAVTNLWANPPTSTEHILHPERYYAGDAPQEIIIQPADQILGDGWRLIRDDVLGEFFIRQYLGQQLNTDDVNYGALGWGGDRYHVYLKDQADNDPGNDDIVLIFKSGWDNATEVDQFGVAWGLYADAAYGGSIGEAIPGSNCRQAADLVCSLRIGNEWIIVRAPTLELAGQILSGQ